MRLLLSNAQGELYSLERARHAYHYVVKSEGGSGKKGGLSAYAGRVGKQKQDVSTYRRGAEVYEAVNCKINLTVSYFLDKTLHLAAIHKAPEEAWAELASDLAGKGWTAGREAKAGRFDLS